MTERLYYRDMVLLEFDAVAIAHDGDPLHVILDRTAFYPTSGGQPHDTGRLGTAAVIDVIDGDERIVHVVDQPVPPGPVHASIDAARRRDATVQHTAQHVLSALAADQFGWETASVHFGPTDSAIEFAVESVSHQQLQALELAANRAVAAAHPVAVSFEDPVAAHGAGLRKPSDRTDAIRVISIGSIDRSACGGTHVRQTGEIGAIAIVGSERVRRHVRVHFVAGDRVLDRLHRRDNELSEVAASLGGSVDEVQVLLASRLSQLSELRDRIGVTERELASARVDAWYRAVAPGSNGLRSMVHRTIDQSPSLLRLMAQHAAALPLFVLCLVDDSTRTLYLAASADSGIDAGSLLGSALKQHGGRGGGSARVAQGSVPQADAVDAVIATIGHPCDLHNGDTGTWISRVRSG